VWAEIEVTGEFRVLFKFLMLAIPPLFGEVSSVKSRYSLLKAREESNHAGGGHTS